jgi:hypothetical protein
MWLFRWLQTSDTVPSQTSWSDSLLMTFPSVHVRLQLLLLSWGLYFEMTGFTFFILTNKGAVVYKSASINFTQVSECFYVPYGFNFVKVLYQAEITDCRTQRAAAMRKSVAFRSATRAERGNCRQLSPESTRASQCHLDSTPLCELCIVVDCNVPGDL